MKQIEITHRSKIKITPFFEEILGAKLDSYRQSWGAIDLISKRVFLKVWKDYIHQNKGEVEVFWENYKAKSYGKPERQKHLEAIQNGAMGIGVLCERVPHTRIVKTFDDEQLLLLGNLNKRRSVEYGWTTYARIIRQFPISELGVSTLIADIKEIETNNDPTTLQALVNARIGQGKFGAEVRKLWNYRCSVTGSSTMVALEASHIQRWADSDNTQRLDPNNGLLLTASLHKLFDAGLIAFDDDGKMLISPKLSKLEQEIFGVIGKKLSHKPSDETAHYLSCHRKKFLK